MSDVLSRILGGFLQGGPLGGSMPAQNPRSPLTLPGEDGRLGGSRMDPRTGPGMGGGGLPGLGGGSLGGGLGELLSGLLGGGRSGSLQGIALMALLTWLMRGRGGAQGMSSLADRMRSAGLGQYLDSWVGHGPNREIPPAELARVFPKDELEMVSRETGLGQSELLSSLSRGLPQMVDRLTPHGQLPERDEDLPPMQEEELLQSFSSGSGPTRRT